MGTPRSARLVALLSFLVLILAAAAIPRDAAAAPPIAIDDGGFQTPLNTSVQIPIATLLANDFDPDGGPVFFDTDYAPFANNGSVAPDYGAQVLIYTPNSGFSGGDVIFYQIEDGNGELDTAIASVFVYVPNNPPVAAGDEYVMGLNQSLTVQGSAGLFLNDYDPDGAGFSLNGYDPSTAPGSLTVAANGGFSYTPAHNLVGTVTFTYTITDGALVSNAATVFIYIEGPTSPPAAGNDAYGTPRDVPLFVAAPGVLGNDFDADGQPISAVLVGGASFGAVNLQANGAFSYTPNAGYVGADSFSYRAFDGTLSSGVATVSITVSATNLPPVPVNDTFQTGRDSPLTIPFSTLLANDTDVDGPALFVLGGQFGSPSSGTLQVEAGNSRVVYTPNPSFIGVDTFTYRISDGVATSQQSASVRITVTNLVQPDPTAGAGITPGAGTTPGATAPAGTTPGANQPGATTGTGVVRPTPPYRVTTLPSVGAGADRGLDNWRLLLAMPLLVIAGVVACRRHLPGRR